MLCDLKTENIGLDKNQIVKIFNFGLARHKSFVDERDIIGSRGQKSKDAA
jgi:serine/threonine protein kinase